MKKTINEWQGLCKENKVGQGEEKAFLKSINDETVHCYRTCSLNEEVSFNSWVLSNLGNKVFQESYLRFFPYGGDFFAKHLFNIERVWRGYQESYMQGNSEYTTRCTVPVRSDDLSFEPIQAVPGFLGTPYSLLKSTRCLNISLLDHENNRNPIHSTKAVLNSLCSQSHDLSDFLARFSLLLQNDRNLLSTPHLFGLHSTTHEGEDVFDDVSGYVSLVFCNTIQSLKWDEHSDKVVSHFFDVLHRLLDQIMHHDRDTRMCRILWNVSASLCEVVHARESTALSTKKIEAVLACKSTPIALTIDLNDDTQNIHARARWLMGLALFTDKPSVLGSLLVWISSHLNQLTLEEKTSVEANFLGLYRRMEVIEDGQYELHTISNPIVEADSCFLVVSEDDWRIALKERKRQLHSENRQRSVKSFMMGVITFFRNHSNAPPLVWKNLQWLSSDFKFSQCVRLFKPEECILFPKTEKLRIQSSSQTRLDFYYGDIRFVLEAGSPLCMLLDDDHAYFLDVFSHRKEDMQIIGLEQFSIDADSEYSCWISEKNESQGLVRFHYSEDLFEWSVSEKTILRPYNKKSLKLEDKDREILTCYLGSVCRKWEFLSVLFFQDQDENGRGYFYFPTYGLNFSKQLDGWNSQQFPGWVIEEQDIPYFFRGIEGDYVLILKERRDHEEAKRWKMLIPYDNKKMYEAIDCDNDGPIVVDQRWFVFMLHLLKSNEHSLEGNLLARKHILTCLRRYRASKNAQLQANQKTILKQLRVRLSADGDPYTKIIRLHIQSILYPQKETRVTYNKSRNVRQDKLHPVIGSASVLPFLQLPDAKSSTVSSKRKDTNADIVEEEGSTVEGISFKNRIEKMVEKSFETDLNWDDFEKNTNKDRLIRLVRGKRQELFKEEESAKKSLAECLKKHQKTFHRLGDYVFDGRSEKSWLKVFQACQKSDETAEIMLGISREFLQEIRHLVVHLLYLSTEVQWHNRLMGFSDNLRLLYKTYNEKRYYKYEDHDYYPLLLMEYVKDIRLSKKQVELYTYMINRKEKGWLREAVMGSGKTTIIPAIVAKWNKGIVLLPESIFEAQYTQLHQDFMDIYDLFFERFDRFYNVEHNLCNYESCKSFLEKGVILAGSPSQFQELEMECINREFAERSPAWRMYDLIRKQNIRVLCDECDDLFRPDIAFVQAHGAEQLCDSNQINFWIRMIRWFSTNNLLHGIISRQVITDHGRRFFKENRQSSCEEAIIKKLEECPESVLDTKSRKCFLALIHEKASWEQFHSKKHPIKVSWLHDLLYSMLPFANQRVCGYDYGGVHGSDVVIPYIEGKETQLQFSTVGEKLILSVLYFYQKGFTDTQFQRYLKHLFNERRDNKNLQGKMDDKKMEPFLRISNDLINLFPEKEDRFKPGYEVLDRTASTGDAAQKISLMWRELLQSDRMLSERVLDSMMMCFFKKQIGFYPVMASVYPVDVAYIGTPCGFSGTIIPQNLDPGYFRLKKNEPNRALMVANLHRLQSKIKDLDAFYDEWTSFEGHCVIDVNKSIDAEDMHEYIRRMVLTKDSKFKHALYFVGDYPYLMTRANGTHAYEQCETTTRSELCAKGVQNFDKLFVYFDAPHCRGIDVPLSSKAKGWVLIGAHCTLDQILQGIGRLRSIAKEHLDLSGQNVELLISRELYNSLGYGSVDEITIIDFFDRLEKRDQIKISKNEVQVTRQFIRHRFRNKVLNEEKKGFIENFPTLFSSTSGDVLSVDKLTDLCEMWGTIKYPCDDAKKFAAENLRLCSQAVVDGRQVLYQKTRIHEDLKNKQTRRKLCANNLKPWKVKSVRDCFTIKKAKTSFWSNLYASENWLKKTNLSENADALIPTVYAAYSSEEKHLVLIHPEEKNNLTGDYKCFQLADAFEYVPLQLNEKSSKDLIYSAWIFGGLFGLLYQKMQEENAFEIYKHVDWMKEVINRFYPQWKWYNERFSLSKSIEYYFRIDKCLSTLPCYIAFRRPTILKKRVARWDRHFGWGKDTQWSDLSENTQSRIVQLLDQKRIPEDNQLTHQTAISKFVHGWMHKREQNEDTWLYYFNWPADQTYQQYLNVLSEVQRQDAPQGIPDCAYPADVDVVNNSWILDKKTREKVWSETFYWKPPDTLGVFMSYFDQQEQCPEPLRNIRSFEVFSAYVISANKTQFTPELIEELIKKEWTEGKETDVHQEGKQRMNDVFLMLQSVVEKRKKTFSNLLEWGSKESLGDFRNRMRLDFDKSMLTVNDFEKNQNYFCWFFNPNHEQFILWKNELKERQDYWQECLGWGDAQTFGEYIERVQLSTQESDEISIDLDALNHCANNYSKSFGKNQDNLPYKIKEIIEKRKTFMEEVLGWKPNESMFAYSKRVFWMNDEHDARVIKYKDQYSFEKPESILCDDPVFKSIKEMIDSRRKFWERDIGWDSSMSQLQDLLISFNIQIADSAMLTRTIDEIPHNSKCADFIVQEIKKREGFWQEKIGLDEESMGDFARRMNISFEDQQGVNESSYAKSIPTDNAYLLSLSDLFSYREKKCAEIGWCSDITYEKYRNDYELSESDFGIISEKYSQNQSTPRMIDVDRGLPSERIKNIGDVLEKRKHYWEEEIKWKPTERLDAYCQRLKIDAKVESHGAKYSQQTPTAVENISQPRINRLFQSIRKHVNQRNEQWGEYFWYPNETFTDCAKKLGFKMDSDTFSQCYPAEVDCGCLDDFRQYVSSQRRVFKDRFPETESYKINWTDSTILEVQRFIDFYHLESQGVTETHCFALDETVLRDWEETLKQRRQYWKKEIDWKPNETVFTFEKRMNIEGALKGAWFFSACVSVDKPEFSFESIQHGFQNMVKEIKERKKFWHSYLGWEGNEVFNSFLKRMNATNFYPVDGKLFSSEVPLTETSKSNFYGLREEFENRIRMWINEYNWKENETLEAYAKRVSVPLPEGVNEVQKVSTSQMYSLWDGTQTNPDEPVYQLMVQARIRQEFWNDTLCWTKEETLGTFFKRKQIQCDSVKVGAVDSVSVAVPIKMYNTIFGKFALRIQKIYRKYLTMRKQVIRMQSGVRMWLAREGFIKKKVNAMKIQQWFRIKKKRKSVTQIQAWWKKVAERAIQKKISWFRASKGALKSCRQMNAALLFFGVFFLGGMVAGSYSAIHVLSIPLQTLVACGVLLGWAAFVIRNAWVMNHSKKTLQDVDRFARTYTPKTYTEPAFSQIKELINKSSKTVVVGAKKVKPMV